MERWVAKVLALVGTFVLPCLCTVLPYKVSGYIASKGAVGKRTLSYLMCLGGGIFFGTYLLHMGPEVQSILKRSLLDPYHITYPVAELIAGIGFFIVLFAEKLVLRWNKKRVSHKRRTLRKMSMTSLKIEVANGKVAVSEESTALVTPTIVTPGTDGVRCTNPDQTCERCLAGKPCFGLCEEKM
jgi:ZIP Zinc transporter